MEGIIPVLFCCGGFAAFLVGFVGTYLNLVPDWKSRQPPKRILHIVFRSDLVTDRGRVWCGVAMLGVLGIVAGFVGGILFFIDARIDGKIH